ncbi:uncharacterized protein SCHCODRAFT_02488522 [Schizophyllum commune H4-8]|uniref:BTB domain-containing protein n=1 Tax=Schizophyllum commune (strain H4-8 / FGSC 9210) TaxID=578458 RepID=D8PL54_SCHCM|nr:uncharacterized protein SCHCODRAFT_02488522 [Schizophyllum commune H4-8]KAI5897533.1 hypothetical protein SCHCODRAFT_02488522 [Schizophyllum commune H4-8]
MQPTQTTHLASRHGTFYLDEGDLVARAEDTLYRFHSFHFQRATTHFDTSIQSLSNEATQEGSHHDRPLVLDGVKSLDFEHLLWFFYESAYRWSGIVDPTLTEKWESILLLAEKFGMKQAAKVACYALGRAGVLSDVHKIALCVKHGLGKDWVREELKRTVSRDEPLTREEGRDLGSDTTILLAAAREALRPQLLPEPEASAPISRAAVPDMFRKGDLFLQAFQDMLNSPFTGTSNEGQTRDCPIVLDLKTHQLRSFLWFLYDSAYEWSYKADPELASKWEDILVVADMFNMEEVCRVATYALDHNGGLPDVRKIALCVRHEVDKSWAFEAIKRVCARQEALTEEEACDMGLKMAINIASAREIAYKSSGGSTTDTSHRPTRHGTYYIDEGDLVVRRATNYFDAKILALSDVPANEGGSDDNPLVLDDVKSQDFEHLMWFFYESAYKWSGVVDPALTVKWESDMLLAEKFDMKQIAKVACYALGRAGVLGDVRKISLCVKHGLGKDWIIEELKRMIERDAHLTEEEGQELGIKTTILLAASREACRYNLSNMPASCKNLPTTYCNCGGYRNLTCGGGVHKCASCTRSVTTCPERDRFYTEKFQRSRINKIVEEMVLPQPGTIPAKLETAGLEHGAAKADLFVKLGASVFAVHSYHLKKASQVFRDMLDLPREGITSEGRSREHPIILNISPHAFESFLWFLYCSAYEWSYEADPGLSAKWEDILHVGDMFQMEDVCRVATYALDHHGGP